MAATNQRKHANQKGHSSKRETVRNVASRAGESISHMRDEMADYISHRNEQIRDLTRDHEGTSVLVALAAGFGVGLIIGCALAPGHRQSKARSYRAAAEGLGRRLMERVENIIPETLSERFAR